MSDSIDAGVPLGAPRVERLVTYKAAAAEIGVPYHQIQRAARAGVFATYRVFTGRKLLKLSEVAAIINRTREGGDHDRG